MARFLHSLVDAVARHDGRLYDGVCARRTRRLNALMLAATRSGDARVYLLVFAVGLLLGGGAARAAAVVAASAGAASGVGWFLKRLVARPRPTERRASRSSLVAHPDAYSFPSSHTAAAVAAAVALGAALGPAALAAALAWAVLVGLSRVYVGAHYPLDVILGAALGAAVSAAALPAFARAAALLFDVAAA